MVQDSKGYYALLNIDSNASNEEIKQSYRNMAKIHHPDRENGNEEMFKKVQEAYETLSDESKRNMYDMNLNVPNGGFHDFQYVNIDMFDLDDIMKNIFSKGNETQPKQKDIIDVHLSLDDVVFGCVKKVLFDHVAKCVHCDEDGLVDSGSDPCMTCQSTGFTNPFHFPMICTKCKGFGQIRKNLRKCNKCTKGFVNEKMEASVALQPGIFDKEKIPLNEHIDIITHHVFDKKKYKIKGNNIHMKISLTIEQALIGFQKEIALTEKEDVLLLKSNTFYDTSKPITIENKGIYFQDKKQRGNLVVKFLIKGTAYKHRIVKFRDAFVKIFS